MSVLSLYLSVQHTIPEIYSCLAVNDLHMQVKVDKQYNVKIEITTYKDGTKDYDVMKIISEIKE